VGRVAGRRPVGWGDGEANQNARALRKQLTPQEVKLWVKLRELKPLGYHFRRQAPIRNYIVDFASFRDRLVIEVDGGQHGMEDGARRDARRDAFLRGEAFRVLRFWNFEVDQNLEGVMQVVLSALHPHPTGLTAGHPPHASAGEG
jgi:very-short-patch-repair endonuclease